MTEKKCGVCGEMYICCGFTRLINLNFPIFSSVDGKDVPDYDYCERKDCPGDNDDPSR